VLPDLREWAGAAAEGFLTQIRRKNIFQEMRQILRVAAICGKKICIEFRRIGGQQNTAKIDRTACLTF